MEKLIKLLDVLNNSEGVIKEHEILGINLDICTNNIVRIHCNNVNTLLRLAHHFKQKIRVVTRNSEEYPLEAQFEYKNTIVFCLINELIRKECLL